MRWGVVMLPNPSKRTDVLLQYQSRHIHDGRKYAVGLALCRLHVLKVTRSAKAKTKTNVPAVE
jgi:hypothetical protein